MGLNTGSIAIWMVFAVLGTCLNLGGGVFAQNQSCLANNAAIDYLFGYQSPHDTIDAEVVLIGEQDGQRISVSSFSEMSEQLNYEMLTRVPRDIPRVIVD